MEELIRVEDIEKYYGSKNNITKAVDRISFTVNRGEFTGIMGASGRQDHPFDKTCWQLWIW